MVESVYQIFIACFQILLRTDNCAENDHSLINQYRLIGHSSMTRGEM